MGRGQRRARAAVVAAAGALAVAVLGGCQTGRPEDPGAEPPPDTTVDPCAGGAAPIESLELADVEGEPSAEDMDWQADAGDLAERVTSIAGDRLAAIWLAWTPERSVQIRLTEGAELPELQAAADASGLVVGIRYDRAYSEAQLAAAAAELGGAWSEVPGVAGMGIDTLGGRLTFDVASGGDGGATTCAALVEMLADAGVPYGFDVFEGPTEGTVRGPVPIGEPMLEGDRLLRVTVPTCNGDPEITVLAESATEVRLEITSTGAAPGWGSDACLDIVDVTLGAPLGERAVIDLSTGDVLDVAHPQD